MKNQKLIEYFQNRGIKYSSVLRILLDINEDRWNEIFSGKSLATIEELQQICLIFNLDIEIYR